MIHYMGFRRWSVVLTVGIYFFLASTGLAACGNNGSTQSAPSVAHYHPSVTQSTQQIQVQQCGFVFGYGALELVPKDAGSPQAEMCFWQAYQHCRAATLVFTSSGTGKGIAAKTFTRTFTLHSANGVCSISDALQEGTSPHSPSPATTYTCTGLVQYPRALDVLGCGRDGTIRVLGA